MSKTQLDRLCEKLNIRCSSEYGAVELPEDWPRDAHPYKVRLRLGRRTITTPFFMGAALCHEPTPADVVSSLVLDAQCGEETFEDFCSNFGYDPDSRKAEATWRKCRAMAPRIRRFLGEHFDAVANAEH